MNHLYSLMCDLTGHEAGSEQEAEGGLTGQEADIDPRVGQEAEIDSMTGQVNEGHPGTVEGKSSKHLEKNTNNMFVIVID